MESGPGTSTTGETGAGDYGSRYAHRPASARHAAPSGGAPGGGDRGKDDDDSRRHRDDAERNRRAARSDNIAVARRRQCADSRNEGPLHTISGRWSSAVWPGGRRAWSAANPAYGSGSGGSDQGDFFRPVRRRRHGWRSEPDLPASTDRT